MSGHAIICQFSSTDELVGRQRTYANIKAVVLKQGRFSIFEAMEDEKSARLFGRFDSDRELILDRAEELRRTLKASREKFIEQQIPPSYPKRGVRRFRDAT